MTGFFHVPSAFGVLEEKVIPHLFDGRPLPDSIRIWVAGCATGEEAYSVAILLFEHASTLDASPVIEIYATDNDKDALKVAEAGKYPRSIAGQMSGVCLDKYFIPEGNGYSVIPEIKHAIQFSSHDVLIGNSFQSFDMITCRHLLTYLDQASQSQIVTFFHHSLRSGGFLFLGDAEFAENLPPHFASVDNIFNIYQLRSHTDGLPKDRAYQKKEEGDKIPEIERKTIVEEPEDVGNPAASREMGDGMIAEPLTLNNSPSKHPLESPEHDLDLPADQEETEEIDFEKISIRVAPENNWAPAGSGTDFSPEVISEVVSEIVGAIIEQEESEEDLVDIEFEGEEQPFESMQLDPVFEREIEGNSAITGEKHSTDLLAQLHRSIMLQEYAPASLLIDRSFQILDYTGRIDRIFDVDHRDLTRDYLDKLPDFYRQNFEDALNQTFHDRGKGTPPAVMLPALPGKKDALLEIQYMSSPDPSRELAQILLKENIKPKDKVAGKDDPFDFFDATTIAHGQTNGTTVIETSSNAFEENVIRSIKSAPFPILLHVEGGDIVEMSQPWAELAGVTIEEAPTLSSWTKAVKGQRLKLKDSRLKTNYEQKGVVCISMRNKIGDHKLLAFHSSYLGKDSKGRKLTLTMAVDITNFPGHSGMGIAPEVADFGVAAKKTFLANMSHEVRTPLTSMIGFADYLTDRLTGQDIQFARYISESGNRLLETLNAVLHICSMDGVENVLRYEKLDITLEAQGVIQLFKPYAEQFGIPLKLVIEQPAKARLDRASFRRVLANLIGNAIKFTPEGEVKTTVNHDDKSVIVEVEDTGIGISEAYLPFIFDRFIQESKGQGRAGSGCGLGLSICKNLVEAMGGTIHVEAEAGVGSKFTVKLPMEPEMDTQAAPKKSITFVPDEQEDRPHILVVEDNVDTQELMLLILRDKYEVTVTSNVTDTLKAVKDRSFDAVLMDLNLSGRRTGFELIQELKRIEGYENVPVLAVSALPIEVIRKQLIREGFNGYIAKPFTRARVLDALEEVLLSESR